MTILEYLMDHLDRQEIDEENGALDDVFQDYLNVHQQMMICAVLVSGMSSQQKQRVNQVSQRFLDWNKEILEES